MSLCSDVQHMCPACVILSAHCKYVKCQVACAFLECSWKFNDLNVIVACKDCDYFEVFFVIMTMINKLQQMQKIIMTQKWITMIIIIMKKKKKLVTNALVMDLEREDGSTCAREKLSCMNKKIGKIWWFHACWK